MKSDPGWRDDLWTTGWSGAWPTQRSCRGASRLAIDPLANLNLLARVAGKLSAVNDKVVHVAQYEGVCLACRGEIQIGQSITPMLYGWFHLECDTPETMKQFFPGRDRSARGYTVVCPTCDAGLSELCLTINKKKRPMHPARLALVGERPKPR